MSHIHDKLKKNNRQGANGQKTGRGVVVKVLGVKRDKGVRRVDATEQVGIVSLMQFFDDYVKSTSLQNNNNKKVSFPRVSTTTTT